MKKREVAFRFPAKQYTQGVTGWNGGGFGGPAATPPYERALRAPFLCLALPMLPSAVGC